MIAHYTVTLSGSAQALGAGGLEKNIVKVLGFQPDPANTHVIYVGGDNATVTSADFGFVIPLPPSNVPAPPIIIAPYQGMISLNNIYVLGTANEKLHLFVIRS